MMFLTEQILRAVMPHAGTQAIVYVEPLQRAMAAYEVDTKKEVAAYLATIAEESGELHFTREIWGPTAAQILYEGNERLGNTEKGDGFKYRGGGLIQCTGRENYRRAGDLLGKDFLQYPELLEQPVFAAMHSSFWWWDKRLDPLANREDFRRVTKVVNGGLTNFEKRYAYYLRAKEALGI